MELLIWIVVLLSVIVVLSLLNDTVNYYAKFAAYIAGMFIVVTLWIPVMLFRPRDPKNAGFPSWGCTYVTRLLGVKLTIRGTENLLQDKGCVVLLNHQSALDIAVLCVLYQQMQNCRQVAKKSILYYSGLFGLGCWLWGTIFIDRLNVEASKRKINKIEESIVKQNSKLLMFAEGTRGTGNEILPFKKGAFHVAISAQCPILPVVISKYHFVRTHPKRYFGRGEIIMTILPSVEVSGKTKEDVPYLIEMIRGDMAKVLKETSAETATKHV